MNMRPQTLDDYIGQNHIKDFVNITVTSAKQRGEPLSHTILTGPSGVGKTTLALIIANMIGANCRIVNAAGVEGVESIKKVFGEINSFDVIFIDEIHRLPVRIEELLYHPMEDGILEVVQEVEQYDPLEWGRYRTKLLCDRTSLITPPKPPKPRKLGTETVTLKLPPFTLIGATTNEGSLTKPLRDRFGNTINLTLYSDEEMALIAKQKADMLNINITDSATKNLARRCRSTARVCVNHIGSCRDVAQYHSRTTIDDDIVEQTMLMLGIDQEGLTHKDLAYLEALSVSNRPQGVNALASRLGESRNTLEEIIEPFLISKGFVVRTSRGRTITEEGKEYLWKK